MVTHRSHGENVQLWIIRLIVNVKINMFLICVWPCIINVGKVIRKPTRCNNNSFIDLQDQLNMFRANFCPSSGAQDWGFFTTYGVVSCKDGYTNSYVVRMWYVVLIKVIMNWWVCNVMVRYLLVLYPNVYGKIVAYVVVRSVIKLYMFRAASLPIIRSFRAGSGWNCVTLPHKQQFYRIH